MELITSTLHQCLRECLYDNSLLEEQMISDQLVDNGHNCIGLSKYVQKRLQIKSKLICCRKRFTLNNNIPKNYNHVIILIDNDQEFILVECGFNPCNYPLRCLKNGSQTINILSAHRVITQYDQHKNLILIWWSEISSPLVIDDSILFCICHPDVEYFNDLVKNVVNQRFHHYEKRTDHGSAELSCSYDLKTGKFNVLYPKFDLDFDINKDYNIKLIFRFYFTNGIEKWFHLKQRFLLLRQHYLSNK